jgi:hypothetical protein
MQCFWQPKKRVNKTRIEESVEIGVHRNDDSDKIVPLNLPFAKIEEQIKFWTEKFKRTPLHSGGLGYDFNEVIELYENFRTIAGRAELSEADKENNQILYAFYSTQEKLMPGYYNNLGYNRDWITALYRAGFPFYIKSPADQTKKLHTHNIKIWENSMAGNQKFVSERGSLMVGLRLPKSSPPWTKAESKTRTFMVQQREKAVHLNPPPYMWPVHVQRMNESGIHAKLKAEMIGYKIGGVKLHIGRLQNYRSLTGHYNCHAQPALSDNLNVSYNWLTNMQAKRARGELVQDVIDYLKKEKIPSLLYCSLAFQMKTDELFNKYRTNHPELNDILISKDKMYDTNHLIYKNRFDQTLFHSAKNVEGRAVMDGLHPLKIVTRGFYEEEYFLVSTMVICNCICCVLILSFLRLYLTSLV